MSRKVIVLTKEEQENTEKLLPVLHDAWFQLHRSTSAISLMDTAMFQLERHISEDKGEWTTAKEMHDKGQAMAMDLIRKAQDIMESVEELLREINK